MCGIAGKIFFDRNYNDSNTDEIKKAVTELLPRGPDGYAVLSGDTWQFAHTRLSIIDLSSAGNQPMQLDHLGLTITYNGEIYNYKEIRKDLIAAGYTFKSTSDTEVLLSAYHYWGVDFVKKLNGMFAFCIFDKNKEQYIFARDRLGIKPLYYATNNQRLCFSSNIKSLLCFSGIDTEINPEALHNYMSLHGIVIEPNTILKGINKLPAAHIATLKMGEKDLKISSYWHASYGEDKAKQNWSEQMWLDATTKSLKAAVARRLVADVPVGLFLSGGVDSSLIAALIYEQGPKSLETFSVGFASLKGEDGNEFKYSDIVAKKYATKHHQIKVSAKKILENLDDCIGSMNEPMVSYDNIGFYLLSKFSSKSVKVVQSGQGADEVFAGYHWYPKLLDSKDALKDYKTLFLDREHSLLSQELAPKWLSKDFTSEHISKYFAKLDKDLDAVTKALSIDTHIMLVEDPVKRVDSNTMRWGLEARVPFLDHELIELVASMPAHLKINSESKYILKKIAANYVPEEVLYRPKGYFPVPELKHIRGPFKDYVLDHIDSQKFKDRGIFSDAFIKDLAEKPEDHITNLQGNKLWQVASLEIWLKQMGL